MRLKKQSLRCKASIYWLNPWNLITQPRKKVMLVSLVQTLCLTSSSHQYPLWLHPLKCQGTMAAWCLLLKWCHHLWTIMEAVITIHLLDSWCRLLHMLMVPLQAVSINLLHLNNILGNKMLIVRVALHNIKFRHFLTVLKILTNKINSNKNRTPKIRLLNHLMACNNHHYTVAIHLYICSSHLHQDSCSLLRLSTVVTHQCQ
jgi:hypothetical protein